MPLPNSPIRDPARLAAFRNDGYLVVPFLDASEVARLRQVYFRHHREDDVRQRTIPSYSPGFYSSSFNNDTAYRRAISDAVIEVCRPALERLFKDFKVFGGGFLVKLPDPAGCLRVHQDPTLVDESRFTPVNVWCPLQDIGDRNGALLVLPGSDTLFHGPRATTIPPPWKSHESLIESRMTPVYLEAGSAVVFAQATLHASQPNVSDQPRIVATIFVSDRSASLQTAYRNEVTPGTIDLYAQDDDYVFRNPQFSSNSTGTPELGRFIESVPYDGTAVSEEAIARLGHPSTSGGRSGGLAVGPAARREARG